MSTNKKQRVEIALNAWAFDPSQELDEVLDDLRSLNYDAVELNLDSDWPGPHSLTWEMTDEEVLKFGEKVRAHGLKVCSISSSMYKGQLGSTEEEDRKFGQAIVRRQLHLADLLGAERILIVPSGDQSHSLETPLHYSLQSLRELEEVIQQRKIFVGVEQVWDSFFMSPYDMKRYIEALNNPWVGVYFDVGNMLEWQSCESWLEILSDDIVGLHIKDYQSNNPYTHFNGGEEVPIGEGMCDWEQIIPRLLSSSYEGAWVIESFKTEKDANYKAFYKKSIEAITDFIRRYGGTEA